MKPRNKNISNWNLKTRRFPFTFKFQNIFFLSCLFYFPAFGEIDFSGFLRVRGVGTEIQNNQNVDFSTHHTVQLKASIHPSPTYQTHFWLLSSSQFGEWGPLDEIFRIHAVGQWAITENLEFRIGRMPYETGFRQIISFNNYEDYPYAFEGAFLSYNTSLVNVDLWGAYVPKTWKGSKEISEFKYGAGIFLDIKSVSEYLNRVNLHLTYLEQASEKSSKMTRYGLGFEGNIPHINVDYSLLGIAHGSGFKFKPEHKMYHVKIAYSQVEWYNSQFFGGYHNDSQKYNPWLYDRHDYGGLLDILLWGNLRYFFLGYSISFTDLFDLKICFYDMRPTEEGDIHLGRYGSLLLSSDDSKDRNSFSPQKNHLGRELDIQLRKEISKDFLVDFLAGVFFPGKGMKTLFKDKNYYSNIQLSTTYKF